MIFKIPEVVQNKQHNNDKKNYNCTEISLKDGNRKNGT